MNGNNGQENRDQRIGVSRREVLAGGAVLLGATLTGLSLDKPVGWTSQSTDVMKPVILPKAGSTDPVEHSIAENAFWNEQLMEHAAFFVMLMPGPELADERRQAEQFQQRFAGQLERAKKARLDRSNYAAFNAETVEMIKPFAEWKRRNADLQASGKLKSLTWSTFFDHTASEAERFARRLGSFSRGNVNSDMKETAGFWTQIMGEHADFIAHLLDPAESELIMKAMRTSSAFHKMNENLPHSKTPVANAVDEIIDFKIAAEKGIQTGKIKSIIHPTLADHVRREALKAADDLKRAS